MVLSTAIPTLIAAIVIVIKSSGIDLMPIKPRTKAAGRIFGIIAIIAKNNERNNIMNIKIIEINTKPIVCI